MKGIRKLLVLSAAIGGCGSSHKTTGPESPVAACMQLHEAGALRSVRCAGGAAADWRAWFGMDACEAYTQHIRDGQVAYHPEKFAACLAEYDRPCDEAVSNCAWEVLQGLVLDGQHCQDTEVCGTYSGCFNVGTATCGEVCIRFGVENETCGIYCGGTTPCLDVPACAFDLVCVNNVCVKTKAAGQTCGPSDPVTCSPLLFCSADPANPGSTGTCQKKVSGGPCHVDNDCPGPEFCLQSVCTVRRNIGQPCTDAPTGCASWTVCDSSTGSCVNAAKPGLPCANVPGTTSNPWCVTGTCRDGMTCVAYAGPGGSCQLADCAPGSSCDTTLMCVACPP